MNMMDKKGRTYLLNVSGAKSDTVVIPEDQNRAALIRRLFAKGNNAGCVIAFGIPRGNNKFLTLEALGGSATTLKVPVTEAGTLKFNGKLLAVGDKLLIPTAGGYQVVNIASRSTVADADYCTVTIAALGVAVPKGSRVWVVFADTDITALPTLGNAEISIEYAHISDRGAPLYCTGTSVASAATQVALYVERE